MQTGVRVSDLAPVCLPLLSQGVILKLKWADIVIPFGQAVKRIQKICMTETERYSW